MCDTDKNQCKTRERSKYYQILIATPIAIFVLISQPGCYEKDNSQTATQNPSSTQKARYTKTNPGCMECHNGIEKIHPNISIACTECHGGDFKASRKDLAHVQSNGKHVYNDTVPPLDDDLDYQQFVNPSNLRIVDKTCGRCHAKFVDTVKKSLMSHTAGHHSGGLYQAGVDTSKIPRFGTIETVDNDNDIPTDRGALPSLLSLISWDNDLDFADTSDTRLNDYKEHFRAIPEQACVRCHLWTRGKGYRGAAAKDDDSKDGLFRADGCAACHMVYANDGFSKSADSAINKEEKGHPLRHRLTLAVPTEQCVHCHHRGARIGLNFTGRTQMPPRLPSGNGVPGTTGERFNGNFHYADNQTNPPDIHHERGMHCVDCHTRNGIMGDGNIYGHQDQATKIECRTCHGTPTKQASLIDKDGIALTNVSRNDAGIVTLTSKVDKQQHTVTQLVDLVNVNSPKFNAKAAHAMDHNHIKEDGGLECYACHASWMPNCFGCHFERIQNGKGKNLLTGETEEWQALSNNKMFVALRQFSMGINSQRKISPFIVGCHPIADVTNSKGEKILDFVMPVTANGKSGLAHNPTHPHTIRGAGEVRTCVECHRSPPSLGLGSGNYALARDLALVASTDKGVQIFNRWDNPLQPTFISTLDPNKAALAIATVPNIVSGRTDTLFVANGKEGISVYDFKSSIPSTSSTVISGIDATHVSYAAGHLYAVVRNVGIHIYNVSNPDNIEFVSLIDIPTAEKSVLWGIDLFVAAGNAGLVIVDLQDYNNPTISASVSNIQASDVILYSHFQNDNKFASRAYVVDPGFGIRIIDLLPDSSNPSLVNNIEITGVKGVDTYTRYVEATETTPSREHDYLYVAASNSGFNIYDITKPDAIEFVSSIDSNTLAGNPQGVQIISHPAPPGVDDYAYVTTDKGFSLLDVNNPASPKFVTSIKSNVIGLDLIVETQRLDRFVDEFGNELKENSHPGASPLNRDYIIRILRAKI